MTRTHAHASTLITVWLAFSASGCKTSESAETDKKPAAAPAVKVKTAAVEVRKMPRVLTLTGSVLADRQSDVAANVVGRIVSAPVERGQAVKQGQVLVVVDARAAGFTAAAAQAQSRSADSQVKLAEADCERADALLAKGAVSKAEYDRQKTQCSAQLYNATAARANADLATKLAGDTVVRAPFDGTIGERFVNVGEYLQPQTKVASLYRVDPARIQISVPEQAVALVKQGQTLEIHVGAYEDRTFPAVVRYVAPALRPATRDLLVEAVAKNPEGALRPGMFATVELQTGEGDEPTVPKAAVRSDGTTRRIFLARGGVAWEVVVRTGAEKDGHVAVSEPLGATDLVILDPPPGLRDGAAVVH